MILLELAAAVWLLGWPILIALLILGVLCALCWPERVYKNDLRPFGQPPPLRSQEPSR